MAKLSIVDLTILPSMKWGQFFPIFFQFLFCWVGLMMNLGLMMFAIIRAIKIIQL